jgi:hypothetical protein
MSELCPNGISIEPLMSAAQQLLNDLDEKVTQLKTAVQALEDAAGRVPPPEPTPPPQAADQPANADHI